MIRPATSADAAAIAGLLAELGHPAAGDLVSQRLSALDADPRSRVLVAERGGAVVGLATLELVPVLHEAGAWCRVTALVVSAAARGGGVGADLLAEAEAVARAAGCSRVEATSARDRADAHAFYRSLGYESVSAHFLKRLPS